MTHLRTVVNTGSSRLITVEREPNEQFVTLEVTDTWSGDTIVTSILNDKAKVIGKALIESAGSKLIGSIDTKATHAGGWVRSGEYSFHDSYDPDKVQKDIDLLRAVRDKLIEVQKDKKDLSSRRDRIAREVTEDDDRTYVSASFMLRNAIDRIIKLEDAAK